MCVHFDWNVGRLCLTSNLCLRHKNKTFARRQKKITVHMTKYFLHEFHFKVFIWQNLGIFDIYLKLKIPSTHFHVAFHIAIRIVTSTPCQNENLQNIKWFNRLASPKPMKMTVNVNTNNHLITRMINELSLKAGSFEH